MNSDRALRTELIALLDSTNAHMSCAQVGAGFPIQRINHKPTNCPYSPWHLVEHIRIAQWDILEFVLDPGADFFAPMKSSSWPTTTPTMSASWPSCGRSRICGRRGGSTSRAGPPSPQRRMRHAIPFIKRGIAW